jgi:transcriptional regulator with XRE-family HTH domain
MAITEKKREAPAPPGFGRQRTLWGRTRHVMRPIVGGLRKKSDNYLLTVFVHHYITTTMRPSNCKSTVTVTRSVAGITMQQLADVLGCNRNSLQQIELGRLKLSEKMAERIALHTGVDISWLLSNRYRLPPGCRRDPSEPYTREVYRQTRAEISEPRNHPLDLRSLENNLAITFYELCAAAEEAYRAGRIIYFNYQMREFREALQKEWPAATKLQPSMDVAQTAKIFHRRLEKLRRSQAQAQPKIKPGHQE